MLLWWLSGLRHANAFDGGYGLLFDGDWDTVWHAVTHCATSTSLEKLVHVEDDPAPPTRRASPPSVWLSAGMPDGGIQDRVAGAGLAAS
jgi:hypothetical protein